MRIRWLLLMVLSLAGCEQNETINLSALPVLDQPETADVLEPERLVFINYWAVWCKPCVDELPELYRFASRYPNEVSVYAVNFDGLEPDQLRRDGQRVGIAIPSLLVDPQSLMSYPPPRGLPTTYVLDGGALVTVLEGPQTMESLVKVIKQ